MKTDREHLEREIAKLEKRHEKFKDQPLKQKRIMKKLVSMQTALDKIRMQVHRRQ